MGHISENIGHSDLDFGMKVDTIGIIITILEDNVPNTVKMCHQIVKKVPKCGKFQP
jgi:hypothetical protein